MNIRKRSNMQSHNQSPLGKIVPNKTIKNFIVKNCFQKGVSDEDQKDTEKQQIYIHNSIISVIKDHKDDHISTNHNSPLGQIKTDNEKHKSQAQ